MDRKTPDVGTDPIGLLARTAPHAPEYPESKHTVCQNTGLPPTAGQGARRSAKPSFIQRVMSAA